MRDRGSATHIAFHSVGWMRLTGEQMDHAAVDVDLAVSGRQRAENATEGMWVLDNVRKGSRAF